MLEFSNQQSISLFTRTKSKIRHLSRWFRLTEISRIQSTNQRSRFDLVFVTLILMLFSGLSMFLFTSQMKPLGLIANQNNGEAVVLLSLILGNVVIWVYLVNKQLNHLHFNKKIAIQNNVEMFSLLGTLIELRDPDTNGHNLRVTLLTMMFCEALNLPANILVRAAKGALLHDIGKVVVPDNILSKPGPLTNNERLIMQQHVKHGIRLIAESEITREALPVVSGHHEYYDGNGYPNGIKGKDIPIEARIFAIIDVFDALTSKRVYKPAYTCLDALTIMLEKRGSHFDPELLDSFIELIPNFLNQIPNSSNELKIKIKEHLILYFNDFCSVSTSVF